jgi:hypothetical protein
MRKKYLRIVAALAITVALLIPAFIFIGAALAAPLTWVQVNTDGFGFATPEDMASASCMAEYNGSLYAGTHDGYLGAGCAVWRYDGGITWTQVADAGFGNVNNETVFSMAVYDGLLYAGTYNDTDGCEVWSYDGTTWTQEVGQGAVATPTGPGFGSGIGVQAAGSLLVFDDLLYVGAGWSITQIWAYDGTDWTQINIDDFGVATIRGCRALAAYEGQLYAGTSDNTLGGAVWRYDGPTTADWVKVSTDGFGDTDLPEARVMEVWNGQLYAGTASTATPQVWAYDGTNWSDVTPTFPDANNDSVRSMTIYKGALYVGVGNYSGDEPLTNVGTQVYRYSGGAPEQVNLSGFDGDPKNMGCHSLCEYQGDLYAGVINVDWGPTPEVYYGAQVWKTNVPSTWYLAEGSTDGGMETFVLVQNPNPTAVTVDVNFMTGAGAKPGPQDFPVPANSRVTFKVNDFVTDFNVSTMVTPTGGDVICERSMYGGERTWAHDSIGVTDPSDIWFLAEGSTGGDMETFVLVQNPNAAAVTVDVDFMTGAGPIIGPQGYPIPANSRVTFKVNDFVSDFNVSTLVFSTGGNVICERSMYGNERTWATDSIGVTMPSDVWFLAEGATAGDFETFVLVQNPNAAPATVDVFFMTGAGPKDGPQDYPIPANSRVTFKANDYVSDFNVSTVVISDLEVIAERSVYGGNRTWAHDSIGTPSPEYKWYLAEGSTDGGMETFVLVQNPNAVVVTVDVNFMTGAGAKPGPQDFPVPAFSRVTFKVNDYVSDFNVSTMVVPTGGPVICERSMYGNDRTWAHDSIGYAP